MSPKKALLVRNSKKIDMTYAIHHSKISLTSISYYSPTKKFNKNK